MRVLAALALCALIAGCAKNAEVGFAGHPLDCTIFGNWTHSDCSKGTFDKTSAEVCKGYGFKPGTDDFSKCQLHVDTQRGTVPR